MGLPLPSGYVIVQISTVGLLTLAQDFLKLLDFHTRAVYSGSDLIWSAELSWVWRVFLTLGLLFVVLNILLQFHAALGKAIVESTAFFSFFTTSVPSCPLESHRQGALRWKGRFCSRRSAQVPAECQPPRAHSSKADSDPPASKGGDGGVIQAYGEEDALD